MTRTARNILHFPRRQPIKTGVAVGVHYDHDTAHYMFLRHHTGDAPEPILLPISWTSIATRGIIIACVVYAALAILGGQL